MLVELGIRVLRIYARAFACMDHSRVRVVQFKAGEVFKTKKEQNQENEIVKACGPRVRLALDAVQCAPCPVLVQRKCVGLHRDFNVVCSRYAIACVYVPLCTRERLTRPHV